MEEATKEYKAYGAQNVVVRQADLTKSQDCKSNHFLKPATHTIMASQFIVLIQREIHLNVRIQVLS